MSLPYLLIGVAFSIAISFLLGYSAGKEKFYEYRANVESAQKQAAAESAKVSAEISESWAASLAWHRDHPRIVRVRDNACGLQVPGSALGVNVAPQAPATDTRPDVAITAQECEAKLNDGIEDAARLAWLQSWVAQQSEVGK